MIVEFDLNGTRRIAEVRREGARWIVMLDGRQFSASVAEAGNRWSVLLSRLPDAVASGLEARESYDVSIDALTEGSRLVHVNGTAVPLTVLEPRSLRRSRGGDRTEAGAPARVIAPMPGRIVRVLVQRGDAVAARQPVVVVEAMKMENELRAPRAGTVAEVRVAPGASVEANAVLMVLE